METRPRGVSKVNGGSKILICCSCMKNCRREILGRM